MLIPLLTLMVIVTACTALVWRARLVGGYPALDDPYEADDDAQDDIADCIDESAAQPPARQAGARVDRRPLPRRLLLRQIPIQLPPHVDKPLTPEQFAEVCTQWPFLVSAFFRDSAER